MLIYYKSYSTLEDKEERMALTSEAVIALVVKGSDPHLDARDFIATYICTDEKGRAWWDIKRQNWVGDRYLTIVVEETASGTSWRSCYEPNIVTWTRLAR